MSHDQEWFEGHGVDQPPRMTVMPWLFWGALALAMILTPLLYGCADDRYLTKEEDQEMREKCEPHGCMLIPVPAWRLIERALGITGS